MSATYYAAAIFLLTGLTGCAEMNAAMQYDDVKPVNFLDREKPWQIFDRPEQHKLMISPAMSRSIATGVFGDFSGISLAEYQSAVTAWLETAKDGRCGIVSQHIIAKPQREFIYACK